MNVLRLKRCGDAPPGVEHSVTEYGRTLKLAKLAETEASVASWSKLIASSSPGIDAHTDDRLNSTAS